MEEAIYLVYLIVPMLFITGGSLAHRYFDQRELMIQKGIYLRRAPSPAEVSKVIRSLPELNGLSDEQATTVAEFLTTELDRRGKKDRLFQIGLTVVSFVAGIGVQALLSA